MEKPALVEYERARLLRKLLVLLLKSASFVSTLCYALGIAGILLLPAIAKETYVDENALSPGMAIAGGQYDDVHSLLWRLGQPPNMTIQDWVVRHLGILGVDSCLHSFPPHPAGYFSPPLHEDSLDTRQASSDAGLGENVVAVVRAPKGEGNECLVLVTPVSEGNTKADAIAVAISYGVFRHLATTPWLAKDVIWVLADGRYGAYYALSTWLSEYHSPKSNSTGQFLRGGAIQAAVAFEIDPEYQTGAFDLVELRAEGPNGEMPNLDMISTVTFLNRYQPTHGGLRFELARWRGLSKVLGPVLPLLRWAAGEIGRTTAHDYDRHVEMLAACMHRQALGASSGVHGAFRRYTIDALTLVAKPSESNRNFASQPSVAAVTAARHDEARSILKVARLLEGYFRCLNNLLERFHHSSSLYVLASPTRFVSIGDYMIPFALLLASLPLTAAALATQGFKGFCSRHVTAVDFPGQSKTVKDLGLGEAGKLASTGEVCGSAKGAARAGASAENGSCESDLPGDAIDLSWSRQKVLLSTSKAVSGSDLNGSEPVAPVCVEGVLLVPANWTRAAATVVVAHLGGVFLWRISGPLLKLGAAVSQWLQTPVALTSVAVWAAGAAAVLTSAVVAVPGSTGWSVPSTIKVDRAETQARMAGDLRETGTERAQSECLPGGKLADPSGGEVQGESSLRTQRVDWVAFKSATLAAAGLTLGALVNLDYALALLSAVCLVPICLVTRPMRLFLSSAVPCDTLTLSNKVQPVSKDEQAGAKGVRGDSRQDVAASTDALLTRQRTRGATQLEGLRVTQSQNDSEPGDGREEHSPSMAALCAQVREELTRIRQERQEARAQSGLGRLKSAVAGGARWVRDKRRAVRKRVRGRLGPGGASAPEFSKKVVIRQVVLTVGALLATPGPFVVLACEQGKAPNLRVLVERIGGPVSVAMPWLVAGYLPVVALCVRTLFLPPFDRHRQYL